MPQYLSPGVYVEEIPSAVQAIVGVSTSTAGFIGIAPPELAIPLDALPLSNKVEKEKFDLKKSTDNGRTIPLEKYPVDPGAFHVSAPDANGAERLKSVVLINDHTGQKSYFQIDPPATTGEATLSYNILSDAIGPETIRLGDGAKKRFNLKYHPVVPSIDKTAVTIVDENGVNVTVISVKIDNDEAKGVAFVEIDPPPKANGAIKVSYRRLLARFVTPEVNGPARLCTNFSDFTRRFGSFSTDSQFRYLAHAVYGFFYNGGSRCFVTCVDGDATLDDALAKLAAVDEVAIVAAPGLTGDVVRDKLVAHCKVATQDRFAILDSKLVALDVDPTPDNILPPPNSDYAAFYFPWLRVFDPATKTLFPKGEPDPNDDGKIWVPPSGHMAGIYARVDVARGVYKAPANEIVLGALGLSYQVSKNQQDGLNPQGINCIRELNGNIRVWGARTIGGDANGEWRYISVRRTMLYLRESIDEGMQWAVFEPNDLNLWAKITRNVSAFLTTQWQLGMLFGATAQEAFYVKCDAETNPPELREIGQVVTEIGVAIVRPAEFVIFRISQWQPQKGS